MSTTSYEASKKGKKPTPVGPLLEGSGVSDPDNKKGSASSGLDNKTDDKSTSEETVAVLQKSDKAVKKVKQGNTPLPLTDDKRNSLIDPPANQQAGSHQGKVPVKEPWGGPRGIYWNDYRDDGELYSGIKEIWLKITPKVGIASIRIGYDAGNKNNNVEWKDTHGKLEDIPKNKDGSKKKHEFEKKDSDEAERIQLDYPKEKLTRISGSFGSITSEEDDKDIIIIKSLTFHTNTGKQKGPYGPCDEEVAKNSFFDSKDEGEVVGFYGRSCGKYLHAIGVRTKKSTPFEKFKKKVVGFGEIINTSGK